MNQTVVMAAAIYILGVAALADGHATPTIDAVDQDVTNGVVSAREIIAPENGWMVVHRDDTNGAIIGLAPLRGGFNTDVAALLTEKVDRGARLALAVHGESGGSKPGVFEPTGPDRDAPIVTAEGPLVSVITTK